MQTIVVGIDGSEQAAEVLRAALDLAERVDARIHVVRATALPHGFPLEALTIASDGLLGKLLSAAQQTLEHDVAHVPRDRVVTVEARVGTPWQVLCAVANETAADVVVVGTHGHRGIQCWMGSTATRVVNHAPCSVLCVHGATE